MNPEPRNIDAEEAIRNLVEKWALWRDSGDWDRFATVWHDDGVMMATWFQGTATSFIQMNQDGWKRGVRILHFLGGTVVDVESSRAVAQTKMTISQRALVHDVECDVVCTGRFYDFFEKRERGWGLVLRQPIYEKDRLDPVDPSASHLTRRRASGTVSLRLPTPRLPANAHRLRGKARHAMPHRT